MERAFGELEAAFYESGGVLSSKTCAERVPLRRPIVERSDRHALGGRFTATVSLGVPECVELGGYYKLLVAEEDFSDYASYEVDAV